MTPKIKLTHSAEVKPFKSLSLKEKIIGLITYLLRFVVGAVFIYSGFVKAIDPWGTIYKFREYIASMHAPWLSSQATVGAFLLFSFEFLVGVALVTGAYRRWAPRLSMLFMAFMLPLTLWIALADPVADCGCFGDALVLSNWATFWKNVVLAAMCAWLMKFNDRIRCIVIPTLQVWEVCASAAFVIAIGFIGYVAQPLIDYRPYPVGGSLLDEDSTEPEFQSVWTRDGHRVTLPADSIPEGEGWEFVERVEIQGTAPEKAKGLAIYEQGEDVTEDLVDSEGEQVIVFFPSIRDVSIANYYKLNSLYDYSKAHDIDMIAVAAGDSLDVATFRDFSLAEYPIYTAEDTAIKEVVRGNPAVVYLNDGKIVWKNAFQAVPTDDFMDGSTKSLQQYYEDNSRWLKNLVITYICVMLVLILLSHVPMFLRLLRRPMRHKLPAATVAALLMSGLMTSCSKDNPEPQPVRSEKLTVLVYMIASNNLYGNSIIDLNEIKDGFAKCAAEDINVLVYYVETGQAPALMRAEHGPAGVTTLSTLRTYPDDNSSLTASRVSEVIRDMTTIAPAQEYGLFFWSHSTNWLPATSTASAPAYSFGSDAGRQMNVTTLAEAVPSGLCSFIWMDCCLMGSIEMAYQFRDKCDYFVAYPTEVLATGAPYDSVLPALCSSEGSVVKAAQATFNWYAANADASMRQCTISVTDTGLLPETASLAKKIAAEAPSGESLIGLQCYGRNQGVSFYDFKQVFSRKATESSLKAAFIKAIDEAVLYKACTPVMLSLSIDSEEYSGLSVTLPSVLTNSNQINLYHELDWYKAVYAD